jgi:1-deoxy-D-xylulose-5-phosphate reductoisomerase
MRRVVILGSTGSVGTQALDVIRTRRQEFRVVGLAAGGADPPALARQAAEFGVEVVGIASEAAAPELHNALAAEMSTPPKVLVGGDSATEVAGFSSDVVLNAMTGSIGLKPTLAALQAGSVLALANKESLIVGGPLVRAAATPGQIVPVDSEHSAIAQCLRSGTSAEVRRIVLTASGGPFRGQPRAALTAVTPEEALAHPTWDMGPMVTVNSATLVNKGLELIEAHLLFDVPMDRIDVVVHPQSVVHSMVEFTDGSTIAQVSPPDMRLPIALALGWPDRVPGAAAACDWTTPARWDFEPLDGTAFPAVALAKAAGQAGRTAPAVLNAVNEECVNRFLTGDLRFLSIVDTVSAIVNEHLGSWGTVESALTLDDVLSAESWARARAHQVLDGAS